MLLKGKTALITGGNSGIGLATARRFVAEGARVAITGRDAATLAAAASELGVTAIRSDVLDAQARSGLFDRIKDEFGHLDILFANAGIAKFSPIEETLEKDFDDVLRTNVTAVFLTVQAALALMGAGGSIILNGSMAAFLDRRAQHLRTAADGRDPVINGPTFAHAIVSTNEIVAALAEQTGFR